jgi:hypothetical protein
VHSTNICPTIHPLSRVCLLHSPCCVLQTLCSVYVTHTRAERSNQTPQPRHLLPPRVGPASSLTACQRMLHACTAVIVLALLKWLWGEGKTRRAIAIMTELHAGRLRRRRGRASRFAQGIQTPATSTHTCRHHCAHLTGRGRALPTGY